MSVTLVILPIWAAAARLVVSSLVTVHWMEMDWKCIAKHEQHLTKSTQNSQYAD